MKLLMLPPDDPSKVCGECRHWTVNEHTYGGGKCDLPKEPAMLTITTEYFSWPTTYAADSCEQFQPSSKESLTMHYRNGREAHNGDKIAMLSGYGDGAQIAAVGILYDAKPGNDHCNGAIAPIQGAITGACLCDCLHVDDVAALLKEKGLEKRPAGK